MTATVRVSLRAARTAMDVIRMSTGFGVVREYLDALRELDVERVLDGYSGVFVGGTPEWKMKTAKGWVDFAHLHGKRCHIGRMGTEKKVRAALRWGADSIDSALPLWSQNNLKRFLRGFTPTGQVELPMGDP